MDTVLRRGDRRWLPALVTLVLVAMPFVTPLPDIGPIVWILPALAVPLLIAIVAGDPGRVDRRSAVLRALSIALTSVLVLAAIAATSSLILELVQGAPNLHNATTLLTTGVLVWTDALLTFALLYWELDGGGAAERLHAPRRFPDIAFPQQLSPEVAPPGWEPTFPDYLYLALTNSLAFSPTDAMPMTHWAKLVMAVQSLISVAILSLVVANAVNILS